MTVARRVVEQAIGEHLDGTPLEDPNTGKNPAAVPLGKLGGRKGQSGGIVTKRHCHQRDAGQ